MRKTKNSSKSSRILTYYTTFPVNGTFAANAFEYLDLSGLTSQTHITDAVIVSPYEVPGSHSPPTLSADMHYLVWSCLPNYVYSAPNYTNLVWRVGCVNTKTAQIVRYPVNLRITFFPK